MKRILVADDDPAICFLINNVLRESFEVTLVNDGEQALTQLLNNPLWDCVLLDIEMPNKNGMEVLKAMKESPTLQHIPVIILTAVTDLGVQTSALKSGVVTFFRKPFSPTQLRSVVLATTKSIN